MSVGSTFYGTFLPKNCSKKVVSFLAGSLEGQYWDWDRTTALALVPGQPGTEAVRCARWALDRKIVALPRKYRKFSTFLANVTLLQNEYHRLKARILLLWTHAQNLHFWKHFANTRCHRGLFQWSRGHIAGTGSKKILCSGSVSQNHAMRGDKIYKDPVPASIALSASPRRIFYLILLGRDRDRYSTDCGRGRDERQVLLFKKIQYYYQLMLGI